MKERQHGQKATHGCGGVARNSEVTAATQVGEGEKGAVTDKEFGYGISFRGCCGTTASSRTFHWKMNLHHCMK